MCTSASTSLITLGFGTLYCHRAATHPSTSCPTAKWDQQLMFQEGLFFKEKQTNKNKQTKKNTTNKTKQNLTKQLTGYAEEVAKRFTVGDVLSMIQKQKSPYLSHLIDSWRIEKKKKRQIPLCYKVRGDLGSALLLQCPNWDFRARQRRYNAGEWCCV